MKQNGGTFVSQAELPKSEKSEINAQTEERLRSKKSFWSNLALSSRSSFLRIFYLSLLLGFIVLAFSYFSSAPELIVGGIVLLYVIFLVPRAFSRELWHLEKAKSLRFENLWSIKTIIYSLTAYLRFLVYPFSALLLIVFILLGLIRTITGTW